jgi:hypothetical protein
MAKKSGPEMFADLDDNERGVLWAKLTAGRAMAVAVDDHGTALEISTLNMDVVAPWAKDGAK